MAHIILRKNPLQPNEREIIPVKSGISVREAIVSALGSADFELPVLVSLNDIALMRCDWSRKINESDCITVANLAAGDINFHTAMAIFNPTFWLSTLSYAALPLLIPLPVMPASMKSPEPVFSLAGKQNTHKLMQPIEVAYGRNILYPSYAARPYSCYKSNQQYLYQLLCLGQGHFEIHGIKIEDTEISSFHEIQYEIVPPGGEVTLFPDNVVTVEEVGGLELFGENETEFKIYGPFSVCPSGTKTNLIEYDVTLPQGLYFMQKNGGLANFIIDFLIEAQKIDDHGSPLGDWFYLDRIQHIELGSNQPHRLTYSVNVPEGRYQIRGQRIGDKDLRTKAVNTIIWEAARAFIPSKKEYGDVTMLAIVAQASNNLNNNTASKINVDATRKLKYRKDGAWTWGPTRGIAWAFFDLLTSQYGGQIPENYIDIDELDVLDTVWESRNEHFDYIFNQKTTVWESAKTIARCGRAVPVINGSQISLVRDSQQSIPMGVFGVDNIVSDSFKWDVSLFDPFENDSVEITYVNPETGNEESILCLPPGSQGANPDKLTFSGCTDRNHAYREGLYIAMCRRLLRETVSFKTGMEGYNPSFGDLIYVSYPLPKWGISGHVTGRSGNTLHLSEPVEFAQGETSYIILRKNDGSGDGPIPVTPVEGDPKSVMLNNPPVYPYDFDSAGREPVLFAFGAGENWSRRCKITEISPSGDDSVDITCVVHDEGIYQFDTVSAPPPNSVSNPPTAPALPVIKYLNVSPDPAQPTTISIAWSPAVGATSYLLQASFDGVNWVDATATTGTTHIWATGRVGMTWLRVCGYSPYGKGNWFTWSGEVGLPVGQPFDVDGLALASEFTGTSARIKWNPSDDADSYLVKVYRDGKTMLLREEETLSPEYAYTIEMMRHDGEPERKLHFEVVAKNSLGESETPAAISVENPVPARITEGLTSYIVADTSEYSVFRLNWPMSGDTDFSGYRVWGSVYSGFEADNASLKTVTTANQTDITLSKVSRSAVISSISKSSKAVVTALDHGFRNGEKIIISDVSGMTEVNGHVYTIKNATANTFEIYQDVYNSGAGIVFRFDESAGVPVSPVNIGFEEPVNSDASGVIIGIAPVDSSNFNAYVSGGKAEITPVEPVSSKYYWRVAALDVWGTKFNVSPEQTAQ